MFIIWHDSDYDFAFWVYKNSSLKSHKEKTILREIPKTNNPNSLLRSFKNATDFHILPVIKYERPDLILQHIDEESKTSKVIFVTEFMTHTPQWQHPAQRFGRIYGASALGIPTSLVLPKTKVKLERGRSDNYKETFYTCSPVIYSLFVKTSIINQTPTLVYHWPDVDGYLEIDVLHPTAPAKKGDIVDWFTFLELAVNSRCSLSNKFVQDRIKKMKSREKIVRLSNYLTIKGIYPTQQVISKYKIKSSKLSKPFTTNKNTLIFEPTGLAPPSSYFRTDPYAGMLCAFDNLFCRDDTGERIVNILLRAKDIKLRGLLLSGTFKDKSNHDVNSCPFRDLATVKGMTRGEIEAHLKTSDCPYTSSKQQRIYGEVSDAIVFDDFIYYR